MTAVPAPARAIDAAPHPAPAGGADPSLLAVVGATKTFRGVVALDGVSFDLRAGEVHALLGENGAGKSTLINLIAGTYGPSAGHLVIDGARLDAVTPRTAVRHGIAAVFQEFSLAPDLSVVDNIFLGRERSRHLFLSRRSMRREAEGLIGRLGFDVPLDVKIATLSRAQKQMVEIAKALRAVPRVLILDEPTASLTGAEAETLFAAMAVLKAGGAAIIYVSHRMAEIRQLSDRVTVLRGGRLIGTVATRDTTDDALIAMMVGRPMEQLFPAIARQPGAVRLTLTDVTTASGAVRGASLTARAGEIVGLAGLVGCGRSELCRAIFGLEPMVAGRIEVGGRAVANPTPAAMLANGTCYFPADRGAEGLATSRPVAENVTMAALRTSALGLGPLLAFWREKQVALAPLTTLALRPLRPERRVSAFSGGNQQKVMLARGLLQPFDVYLFDEPTVGIDVGAKTEVYGLIKKLTEAGACVVLSTSELPELINLASRIYVMHEGAIVAELSGAAISESRILSHYFDAPGAKEVGT